MSGIDDNDGVISPPTIENKVVDIHQSGDYNHDDTASVRNATKEEIYGTLVEHSADYSPPDYGDQ